MDNEKRRVGRPKGEPNTSFSVTINEAILNDRIVANGGRIEITRLVKAMLLNDDIFNAVKLMAKV